MRTPEAACRDVWVYLRQTLPRRRAARAREKRPAQALELDQVERDLERIVALVPPCLLEERTELDFEQRRREINAVYAAAFCGGLSPTVARDLWALRARLIQELRGEPTKAAAPVPQSSRESRTCGAPGTTGEP